MSAVTVRQITAQALRERLAGSAEIALIDVREEGAYSAGHLFHASCLPASRIELVMRSRLPRRDVSIVLTGGSSADDTQVHAVAQRLHAAGYTDVQCLGGGVEAWQAAGHEVFTGVNVPSKAFGEFVEHWHDTPRMPAEAVYAMQQRGEPMVILDSRPFDEFTRMSIPGGIDCPGAELLYRVHSQVSDDHVPIIVNCAGRTRSIIGAQSLINAGIANPVYALKDGTMGWKLAGLPLAKGATDRAGPPGQSALDKAIAHAREVMRKHGVRTITAAMLQHWLTDDRRTTLVLDVRSREEYAAGHRAGAIHAPGGQLVQATDEYVAVRNARLVLADSPDAVRGTMTAHWLGQMGWQDVHVLAEAPAEPVTGLPEQDGIEALGLPGLHAARTISAGALAARLPVAAGTSLLDFGTSTDYRRRGHVPGACWAHRTRLSACIASLADTSSWILLADDERLAHLAAGTLRALRPHDDISVLAGGTPAWQAGGYPLEREPSVLLTHVDDVWNKPYDGGDPADAMRAYLTWEVGLVAQVEREGLARFRRTG